MIFCIKNEVSSIPCVGNSLVLWGAIILIGLATIILWLSNINHKQQNSEGINGTQLISYPDRSLIWGQFYSASGEVKSPQIKIELVNTQSSIEQGLSGRTELGADGMLFVFAQKHKPSFWMKEMQFELDFIWLRGGQVVDLTANVPAPSSDTPLSELPTYSPSESVDWVLELPAGSIEQWQVELSDQFVLSS